MKIVLDLFILASDHILIADHLPNDPVVADCLTTIWSYLPENTNPLDQIKIITKKLGVKINKISVAAIGLVHYEKDATNYLPITFKIEAEKIGEPAGEDMFLNPKWLKLADYLNSPRLYEEYKKHDLQKILSGELYFFTADNDFAGTHNLQFEEVEI